ncbi:MAG: cysteine peptidase family C39 domain-containing protein [Ardenticatenaceae bacterium]
MKAIMLPVPPFRQLKDGECLAACAGMVLNYLKIPFSYSRLLKLLRVQWFGTAHSNIRYLTRLGVRVIHKQGTLTELHQHLLLNRPCIVFVKTGELPYWNIATPHAVVVVGLDSQYVYLNDPEFDLNPIPVSLGDFDLAWFEHGEFYAVLQKPNP